MRPRMNGHIHVVIIKLGETIWCVEDISADYEVCGYLILAFQIRGKFFTGPLDKPSSSPQVAVGIYAYCNWAVIETISKSELLQCDGGNLPTQSRPFQPENPICHFHCDIVLPNCTR